MIERTSYTRTGILRFAVLCVVGIASIPFAAVWTGLDCRVASWAPYLVDAPCFEIPEDLENRSIQSCARFRSPDERTLVLLAIGQSNAANSVAERFYPDARVSNFDPSSGICYQALDPLIGASGTDGSVWSRLGHLLVTENSYDQVLLIVAAAGGTSVADWASSGARGPTLRYTLAEIQRQKIQVTHIAWQQGESDSKLQTPRSEYEARLHEVIRVVREAGVSAPFFVARASRCGTSPPAPAIRNAQNAVAETVEGAWHGPDTDQITGPQSRPDGCHLSAEGATQFARLWQKALLAIRQEPPMSSPAFEMTKR